ncbi:MAG: CNP1-like family protein, partial [Candidatus Accumulibacter sp.]|nr:CNP1-like family protein [Accumulibacter sp.]
MAVTFHPRWFAAVFSLMLLASPKPVFPALFDNEFDTKPWQEIEVALPAFPELENLIPFEVGAVRHMRFSIDEKSISVDSDEVIRYSLVAISASGARNISFEGMRCATGERRIYAFGRSDGTWS